MKLAIIGSRGLCIGDLSPFVPENVSEIVSGGARGIDACAAEYAQKNNIPLTVFLPDYSHFGKGAPLKRNNLIADYADEALIFWDGSSRGTAFTIEQFKRLGKHVTVICL